MKLVLLAFHLLFLSLVSAQEVLTLAGNIVNAETGDPVEFVNIGFKDMNIGTVSRMDGSFSLEIGKGLSENDDALIISSIGYETEHIPRSEWASWTTFQNTILLQPKITQLAPVLIIGEKRGFERLGSETYSLSELGYWNDSDALGGELATRIEINKERTRLHNFKFHVIRNDADSVKVRINIYSCNRNMPGENLLSNTIYHTITNPKGIEEVPLKQHNVVVDDDIVVGIEMVDYYGEELYLSVSATPFGGTAYLRERSMAAWDVRWNFGLAFGLLSSYPEIPSNP